MKTKWVIRVVLVEVTTYSKAEGDFMTMVEEDVVAKRDVQEMENAEKGWLAYLRGEMSLERRQE